jgi:uncharacterized protein
MKRPFLVLALCLSFASVSVAQQNPAEAAPSKEDIQRYLEAVHTRQLIDTMFAAIDEQMHKLIHDMVTKQPNLPSDFEARMDKMMDDTLKDFPVDDFIQVMIPIYQKHLTKGDVDALVAFYTTPTGQKILKELPAMTSEAMQASAGLAQKMMAKVMDRVQQEIAEELKTQAPDSSRKPQTN